MYEHKSVLLNEAIEYLNIKEDGIYVDATTGGGGHSRAAGVTIKNFNYRILKTLLKELSALIKE